ncbi:MAG: LLM class flavin-dependent oxidoreductase [Chloroflexota bacterium]|nr:MAG: LLM class flavin-dependent oxidoreductase [Chloroflexota bacterium]
MGRKPVKIGAPGGLVPPFDAVVKTAQRNEEQGFDSLWFPDHFMAWHPESIWTPDLTPIAKFQSNPHIFYDTIGTMAVVGSQTQNITLGTSVTEPIRRHPALLAQEFLTLDHITKGRVVLGIGAGEGENIIPYGLDFSQPASRLEEALRIIRLLWENNGPVDYDGKYWKLKDAVMALSPYQPGKYPPIWVAAHGPRMLRMTGELADGWLPTKMEPDEYGEKLQIVRNAAKAVDRDPDAITPAMWTYLVIDEDPQACEALLDTLLIKALCLCLPAAAFERHGCKHPLGDNFYGLTDYIPTRYGREEALAAINKIPHEVVKEGIMHGTPDDLAQQIDALAEKGLEHIVLWNITFTGDMSKMRSSYQLMSDLVKRVHGANQ